MKFFETSSQSEAMAASLTEPDDIVFIPAFVGLGAPHWNMNARGAIFGITRDTGREQIVRAALKSIALQSMDLIDAMEQDTGKKIRELRVDGGATNNRYLMQFQADILNIPVLLPENTESTALGAAYLAGVTAGLYNTLDEIAVNNAIASRFDPAMDRVREQKLWREAIQRLVR
jgi:glycerol kinase